MQFKVGAISLIFRYTQHSRYSIAALLGAIEVDPRLSDLEIHVPRNLSSEMIRGLQERTQVIVAYSAMSTQFQSIAQECSRLRREFGRDITIVGGGPHATARPKEMLGAGFDYVVVGEGERTFPQLLCHMQDDKDPQSIPGVVGRASQTYPRPSDLSRVQLDDYPPFALDMNIVGPIEVTRGCPFHCKFCATPFISGGVVRHRSVEMVAHWLAEAVKRRGFRRAWLLSPNALCYGGHGRQTETDRLERLLSSVTGVEGLEEVFFGAFPSEVRPEFVTRRALEIMRHYVANKTIQIGLQSGSDRVLEDANRHHTVEDGIEAARIAFDCGFIPHVDFIFGLPGERFEDQQKSLEVCQSLIEIGAQIHSHVFMPLPGSEYERFPPGKISSETRAVLGDLSRRGMLTGAWDNQERLAQELHGHGDGEY
ncbi:MAG: TIGR04013 family B12-binding domain/radical SAM domain-containing protein [Candidatus Thorarchaeota archaeon]|nr:TIGR04013 family B12-binding domain/radical SAM domain-containing protein [Candidatus Thorarchaeota archaeon]